MNKEEILNYLQAMIEEADTKSSNDEDYNSSQLANELQILQDEIYKNC